MEKLVLVDNFVKQQGLSFDEVVSHWKNKGFLSGSNKSISERVKKIVSDKLSVPKTSVTDDATFKTDLIMDSLGQVEIVVALEREFDIAISDETAFSFTTVGDVIKYITDNV